MIGIVRRGTLDTVRMVQSLTKLSDGSRIVSGAAARTCVNGTWGAAGGTLAIDETDQYKYTLSSGEAAAITLEIAVDHADAIGPIGGLVLMLPAPFYDAMVSGTGKLPAISENLPRDLLRG